MPRYRFQMRRADTIPAAACGATVTPCLTGMLLILRSAPSALCGVLGGLAALSGRGAFHLRQVQCNGLSDLHIRIPGHERSNLTIQLAHLGQDLLVAFQPLGCLLLAILNPLRKAVFQISVLIERSFIDFHKAALLY